MLTPAQPKRLLPLRMTRSALALLAPLALLALAPPVMADVPPPHPLGHRSITRQHQFRGASRWPDQVFFVWPVLPTGKPCACTADVIGEDGTGRDRGVGGCSWLVKAGGARQERERTDMPRPRLMALPKAAFARLELKTIDI